MQRLCFLESGDLFEKDKSAENHNARIWQISQDHESVVYDTIGPAREICRPRESMAGDNISDREKPIVSEAQPQGCHNLY